MSATIFKDRIMEITTSTGTGPLALAGSPTGFASFTQYPASQAGIVCVIEAVDASNAPTGDWEIASCTLSADRRTLTRNTVRESSNAGAAVSFPSGNKRVFAVADGTWIETHNHSTTPLADGAVATPSLYFANDTNTGLYRVGNDNMGLVVGGAKVFDIGTALIASTVAITVPANAYGAGWSGSLKAVTEDAVYDKIEAMVLVDASKAALAGATFTGPVITLASAAGGAGLNLPHGAAPSAPVNGDIWSTTTSVNVRINGTTRQLLTDNFISNTAYGVGWDGIINVAPSQNAIYDKLTTGLTGTELAANSGGGTQNFLRADGTWQQPPSAISDAAFGAGWNGVTGVAPSQNAVYDEMTLKANLAGGNTFTGNQTLNNVLTVFGDSQFLGANKYFGPQTGTSDNAVYFDCSNFYHFWTFRRYSGGSPTTQAALQVGDGFVNWAGASYAFKNTAASVTYFSIGGGGIIATVPVTVPDEAYGSAWNGKLEAPTKNAIWDAGFLTGVTGGQITTALGYTPANQAGDTFGGSIAVSGATAGVYYIDRDGSGNFLIYNQSDVLRIHNGTVDVATVNNAGAASFASTVSCVQSQYPAGDPNFILAKWSGSVPTLIQRVDAGNFYFLLSNAGSALNGTFNSLRPFTITLVDGNVQMANGQQLGGGTVITGTITASGGGMYTGNHQFKSTSGTMIGAGAVGGLQAYAASAADAAFMTFHVAGTVASGIGIDTDGIFKLGGWSWGTVMTITSAGVMGIGTVNATTAVNIGGTSVLARSSHTGTQSSSTITVAATNRFLGRTTAGAGAVEELTVTQMQNALTPPRTSTAATGTVTPAPLTEDMVSRSALTATTTIAAPTGTPVDGLSFAMKLKSAAAQTLSWNAIYQGIAAALPTTTTAGKWMYFAFIYNATDSKWDMTGYVVQP